MRGGKREAMVREALETLRKTEGTSVLFAGDTPLEELQRLFLEAGATEEELARIRLAPRFDGPNYAHPTPVFRLRHVEPWMYRIARRADCPRAPIVRELDLVDTARVGDRSAGAMIQGWRFQDAHGRTWEQVAEELRRLFWRPLRREMLKAGVSLETYRAHHDEFLRILTRVHMRWSPCVLVPPPGTDLERFKR